MGKVIGDADDPLLVSVRSGAKFSMPGMMDTVLNLGLNDRSVEGLAKQTGDERFAFDSYRRFIAMYGRIVLELPAEEFDSLFDAAKELAGTTSDAKVPTELLRYLVDSYQQIVERHTGEPFPQDPAAQLRGAIEAVFRSWNGPRAIAYREPRAHRARPGHRGQRAGHGVRQPRRQLGHRCRLHPRPGHGGQGRLRRLPGQRPGRGRGGRHPQHRAHLRAQEAVSPRSTASCWTSSPASRATTTTCATPSSPLSRASSGCCRPGSASAPVPPPCKMAVDMVRASDLGISKAEAVSRITEDHLDSVLHPAVLRLGLHGVGQGPRGQPRRRRRAGSTSRPTTPRRRPGGARRSSWCAARPRPRTCTGCWPPRGS